MPDAVEANLEVVRRIPDIMAWLANFGIARESEAEAKGRGQNGTKGAAKGGAETNALLPTAEVDSLPPLVLAYVGDAVYELCVRTALVASGGARVRELHRRAVGLVRAEAQAEGLRKLEGFLTPDEETIVRRGRNAKSGMYPRHATVLEYRHSTGFEALLGVLFLRGELERLKEIFVRLAAEE